MKFLVAMALAMSLMSIGCAAELRLDDKALSRDSSKATEEQSGSGSLKKTVEEQSGHLNSLKVTVEEQTALINSLKKSVEEQTALINSLKKTVEELNKITDYGAAINKIANYIDVIDIDSRINNNLDDKLKHNVTHKKKEPEKKNTEKKSTEKKEPEKKEPSTGKPVDVFR